MTNKRPAPRTLEVLRKSQVSPHMLRVTLGGSGLAGFPRDSVGGYVKLRLPSPDAPNDSPMVRTYTIRNLDVDSGELDIDFVLHDVHGPAADWARACQAGDAISVGGPGPAKPVDPAAHWYLFAGDMSALPALSVNLEALPPDAQGTAWIEILAEDDQQDLAVPPGVQLHWVINQHPDRENSLLFDAVRQTPWLDGQPYAWVAGEFSQSLAIRAWLKGEQGLSRQQMYASSYWQIGQTEDGHRVSKRNAKQA